MNYIFKTTAVFKYIITLKSGAHRIIRMSIDKIAKFNAAIRQARDFGLLSRRYSEFLNDLELKAQEILSYRIINERTGEEFLSVA